MTVVFGILSELVVLNSRTCAPKVRHSTHFLDCQPAEILQGNEGGQMLRECATGATARWHWCGDCDGHSQTLVVAYMKRMGISWMLCVHVGKM